MSGDKNMKLWKLENSRASPIGGGIKFIGEHPNRLLKCFVVKHFKIETRATIQYRYEHTQSEGSFCKAPDLVRLCSQFLSPSISSNWHFATVQVSVVYDNTISSSTFIKLRCDRAFSAVDNKRTCTLSSHHLCPKSFVNQYEDNAHPFAPETLSAGASY